MRYKADITAGGLKMRESRIIADLLLKGADKEVWDTEIEDRNILQTRSPETARRLLRLIRGRLALMTPEHWTMVRDGSKGMAVQAVFAAAVKHSALLGDFLDLRLRQEYQIFTEMVPATIWTHYLEDCKSRDPEMPDWNVSTIKRLRSSVFQMLTETGYFTVSSPRKLQKIYLVADLKTYLEDQNEQYVLRCMTACL
jgi:hypothetical protein